MRLIYREYGNTIEITRIEKEVNKVRVSSSRSRSDVYHARRSDSIRRTRQICVRRLSAALKEFGRPLMVTLTFAGDSSDAAFASDSLGKFQVRLRHRFKGCQSLFVSELSPRGRIHFHGLLFGVPLSLGDTRKGRRTISIGEERKTRVLKGLWQQGFVDVAKTDGSPRLAGYIGKYITKEKCHVLFNGMHLLRITQGFPKEFIARDEYAEYLEGIMADDKRLVYFWEGETKWTGSIEKRVYRS